MSISRELFEVPWYIWLATDLTKEEEMLKRCISHISI